MIDISNPHVNKFNNCFVYDNHKIFAPLDEVIANNCYTLDVNLTHYYNVLSYLQEHSPVFKEYIFVLTRNVDYIPIKKDDLSRTIVILCGDEWNRAPKYADKVAFVYKTPGQNSKLAFHSHWFRFNTVVVLQYFRIWLKKFSYPHKKNVFSLPLNIYRLVTSSEVKPMRERQYDVSFMGSVSHNKHNFIVANLLKTPKELSRTKILSVLDELKSKYNVFIKTTGGFPHAEHQSQEEIYSQILMDSKICIAPRGTNLETFRYFEGLLSGCVVIAEEQPDYDYLKESPAIIIKNWDDLPKMLDKLLNDPELLDDLQVKALDYYNKYCSPAACATQIMKDLQQHFVKRNF